MIIEDLGERLSVVLKVQLETSIDYGGNWVEHVPNDEESQMQNQLGYSFGEVTKGVSLTTLSRKFMAKKNRLEMRNDSIQSTCIRWLKA